MLLKIYKEQDGSPVLAGQFQEKLKDNKFGTLETFLEDKCKDVYGCEKVSFPKLVLYQTPEGESTYRVRKGDNTSHRYKNGSLETFETARSDVFEMTDIVYKKDGVEHTEKFGADFIHEGFVIATGKTPALGIFGIPTPTFVSGIGRRNARSAAHNDAKKFPTAKQALTFITKYKWAFKQLTGSDGWKPELQFFSDAYREYLEETMSKKKKAKMYAAFNEANEILNQCIDCPAEIDEEPEYGETPMEEAMIRMKQLQLDSSVIQNFKAGKLMFSEFGGILYFLNDAAKEAVAAAKERGLLPYHVVRTQTEIGDMYAVLYVSTDRNAWSYERRDNASGYIDAFVKNGDIEEYGPIGVDPCNGGLKRTA